MKRLFSFILALLLALISVAVPAAPTVSQQVGERIGSVVYDVTHKDEFSPFEQKTGPPTLALSATQHFRPRWVFTQNNPSFVLNLNDLGAGAVNTTPQFALGSGTPTFTRATTAWTKLSTGLWASVASGTARSRYLGADTTVGAYGGYLAEGVRANDALWSRDLTNAAWTKGATITVAHTATGIDGVANSATTVTGGAVAGTNIVTQAITLASQADTFSCWIERISGTGAVSLTLDNVTYTDISGSINASAYTLVQIQQTVLNPTVGIKVTTNADSVAVDMCQMEPGSFASSPIPTTTVAVTRNADVLTYPSAGNLSAAQGSMYAEFTIAAQSTTLNLPLIADNTSPYFGMFQKNFSTTITEMYDGTNQILSNAGSSATTGVRKSAGSWSGTTFVAARDGTTPVSGAYVGNATLSANFGIGVFSSGSTQLFGTIRGVKIYPTALSAAQLQAMTSP